MLCLLMTKNQFLLKVNTVKKAAKHVYKLRKNINYYHIDNDWLRGFIEAEGSFTENKSTEKPLFQITQLYCDKPLLMAIKHKIGKGTIHKDLRRDGSAYVVYSLRVKRDMCERLLPILKANFVFSRARKPYNSWLKAHFSQAQDLWGDSDLGVSGCALQAYSQSWLLGFTEGDGSFHFVLRKQGDYRWKMQIQAVFDLSQNLPAKKLQHLGAHLFGKGTNFSVISHKSGQNHLRVCRQNVIKQAVLPLFEEKEFQSRKRLDYMFWQLGCWFILNKQHLEKGSLRAFRQIISQQIYYRKH